MESASLSPKKWTARKTNRGEARIGSSRFLGRILMRSFLLLTTAFVALSANTAYAQAAPAEPDAVAQGAGNTQAGAAGQDEASGSTFAATDIIVTAQKRSQRLQDVPINIQAVGSEQIAQRGLDNLGRLNSVVPGVSIGKFSNTRPVIYIRGIGTRNLGIGSEQSVGVFLDDFYVGDASSVFSNISDVERIEVLKGPQGTLYGRNTIGGAISIVTTEPSNETHVNAQASVGNYNLVSGKASISGAIVEDVLQGRLAFYSEKRDGYMYNPTTGGTGLGSDQNGVRGELRAETGDFTFRLAADYNRDTSPGQLGKNSGAGVLFRAPSVAIPVVDPDPFVQANPRDPRVNAKTYGGSLRTEWDPGALTILSLTQVRGGDVHSTLDIAHSALNIMQRDERQRNRYWSQELRFSSSPDGVATFGDHLQWVAGLFYYHQNATALDHYNWMQDSQQYQTVGTNVTNDYNLTVKTRSFAAYIDATAHITDTLDITFGLRYTHDKKFGTVGAVASAYNVPGVNRPFQLPISQKSSSLDPKVTLSWKPITDVMLYATYSSGYKGGGFQYLSGNADLAGRSFGPERLDYYEAGLKSQLFDRRLTLNASVFHSDFKGLQLQRQLLIGTFTDNAATVNFNGAELETTLAVTSALTLNANYTYLNNKFKDYDQCAVAPTPSCLDLSGTRTLRSPKHQVTLGGQYVIETGAESNLTLRADYVYRSKYLLETGGLGAKVGGVQVASTNPGFVEAANNVLDLRATYTLDRWSLAVWGTNLTDNYIRSAVTGTSVTRANGTPGGIGVISYAEPPRMYGMTLGYKF
eukprot:TRINITY_DN2436_c0_g1_i2.p1 TRINITY_DN2436_c0_g1~~TRINITY_DN2436_c0_g1_i2.p1  ORF type:complete len:807 (+),score=96.23 TRINITY_DN2436_c0_g1_i2:456-2876(+)